jgi:hypothetical protein
MRISALRWAALGALSLLLIWLLLAGLDVIALKRLGERLGASEEQRFPAEYFQLMVARGDGAPVVCQRMKGFSRVEYTLLPLGGDSVVVQQFVYPLVIRSMKVSILYRDKRVADVDTDGYTMHGARILTIHEARVRLSSDSCG